MAEKSQQEKENFRYFVRIANTDLDGNKQIHHALKKIKGVSFMLSNMACALAGIGKTRKAGLLSDDEVSKLDEVLANPVKHGSPSWLLNRRKDYEDGSDKHLLTGDLSFSRENDIKRLKKIKSYRGIRHGVGLPLRGQKTKANFRRQKGKSSLGVKKKPTAKSGK